MRFGIVGCGLIGRKRLLSFDSSDRLIATADSVVQRAEALAAGLGASVYADWRDLLKDKEIETVIVATPNNLLAEISEAALRGGKHVIVEKPAARNVSELEAVKKAAQDSDKRIHVGFNHRYHPAIVKAHEIFQSGELGPLLFVRGRYGHGGRIGYDQEWRAQPDIAGGGELIDQG